MAVAEDARVQLSVRFGLLLPHLNERQRRLLLATEARLLGRGGVRAVAQVAKVSETTIRKGLLDLDADQGPVPLGRVRRPGGGRKRAEDNDPKLGTNRWVQEWNLPTEPWIFLVGADGLIKAKFEGAVSVDELERAVREHLL